MFYLPSLRASFLYRLAELVSASHQKNQETLKQVQGDGSLVKTPLMVSLRWHCCFVGARSARPYLYHAQQSGMAKKNLVENCI